MQDKGIIMQIANGHAIVLTKNREFLKIPLLDGMSVGQEVDVPATADIRKVSEKKRNWFMKTWKQTGAVAACLLLAVGFFGSQSFLGGDPKAYAYVTVDINPSIELSIDDKHKVVDFKGLNQDGEQVLNDLKLQGMSVDEAISKLAEIAKNKGYLNEQSEVLITASPAVDTDQTSSDLDQIEHNLVATVQKVTSANGAAVDVEGIVVSEGVRKAAQEAGVSPGKFAFYLSAQSNGVDVDLNALKEESIHAIINKQGNGLAEVMHNIRGGKDLDKLHDVYKSAGKDGLLKQGQDATKAAVQPKESDNRPDVKQDRPSPVPSQREEVKQQKNVPANNKTQEPSNREQGSKKYGNGNSKENHSSNKQEDNNGSRDDQGNNKNKEQGKNNIDDNKKNDHNNDHNNDNKNGRGYED